VPQPVLVWFHDDHRVSDNPALQAALATGAPVLCLFILDEESLGFRPLGGASRWWLHGSLAALDGELKKRGAALSVFPGAAEPLMMRIASEAKPSAVFWNRRYQAAEIAIDKRIKAVLAGASIRAESFNGRLLNEPWDIQTKSGTPFQVYGPYLRAVQTAAPPPTPFPAPDRIPGGSWPNVLKSESVAIESLALEPTGPDWAAGFREVWTRGEASAQQRLTRFLGKAAQGYAENRNRPAIEGTSRLSPHLRSGRSLPARSGMRCMRQGVLAACRRPMPRSSWAK
jgi:deoxyribodipyrimidine photo-lyase